MNDLSDLKLMLDFMFAGCVAVDRCCNEINISTSQRSLADETGPGSCFDRRVSVLHLRVFLPANLSQVKLLETVVKSQSHFQTNKLGFKTSCSACLAKP